MDHAKDEGNVTDQALNEVAEAIGAYIKAYTDQHGRPPERGFRYSRTDYGERVIGVQLGAISLVCPVSPDQSRDLGQTLIMDSVDDQEQCNRH